jgi:hypothetical protein
MKAALSNPEYFGLCDAHSGKTVEGGDQEWYGSWWRRMSGCGPTTAANVVLYLTNARADADAGGLPAGERADRIREKQDFIRLMNLIWKYVTPGRGGVNSTTKLRQGVAGYSAAKGLKLRTEALDIAAESADRPPLASVIAFIRGGLERNLPVAFLNLHNGLELQLDRWHWVTVTGIEYDEAGGAARVDILDNCNRLSVNLGRWLASTERGGGFVRFLL